MKQLVPLLLLCLLITGCAKSPTNTTETEPPHVNSVDVVKAMPQETTLAPGASGDALVRLQIQNGYHVNANPPSQSYLKPTEIELKPQEGISVEFITFPESPLTRHFYF